MRRTDVVLRAAYPQLQTRIFQIGPFAYRIVFDEAVLRADAIRDEFESHIRPITLQVEVSNDLPANFLREISPWQTMNSRPDLQGFHLIKRIYAPFFMASSGTARPHQHRQSKASQRSPCCSRENLLPKRRPRSVTFSNGGNQDGPSNSQLGRQKRIYPRRAYRFPATCSASGRLGREVICRDSFKTTRPTGSTTSTQFSRELSTPAGFLTLRAQG